MRAEHDPPPPLREVAHHRLAACHFAEDVMAGDAKVTHEIDPLAVEDDIYEPVQGGPIS